MKTYNYSWIDFLSGSNVIKVTNEREFNSFKNFLRECGLLEILGKQTEYSDWQRLAIINNKDKDIFLFEYQNYKGLTWSDDIKQSVEWYDKEPINVSELQEFFYKKTLANTTNHISKNDSEI